MMTLTEKKLMHWCTWYTSWVCSIITRKTDGSFNIQMFFRRTGELYLVVLCGTQSFFCFLFFSVSTKMLIDSQLENGTVSTRHKKYTQQQQQQQRCTSDSFQPHTHTHKHILQPIDGVYCYPSTCWGF